MKKKLLSVLLALCMVIGLVPISAFAEGETEEPPVCTCETACTAEAMNADCPVCGAEGALPENCGKCSEPPVNDAVPEPEGEKNEEQQEGEAVESPQPAAVPAVQSGKTEIKSESELDAALSDKSCTEIKLGGNIELSGGYIISRTITLDLNGYTLTVNGTECDIFSVEENGNLTIKDSGTGGKIDGQNKNCGVNVKGGILTLESGTIINCADEDGDGGAVDVSSESLEGVKIYGKFVMNGGAIINCKAGDDGGAVDIGAGCTFIMNSGTISGCRADDDAGAVFVKQRASFEMNGGTIENCSAGNCGGVVNIYGDGRFSMTSGTIKNCTVDEGGVGNAVYGRKDEAIVAISGGTIENCGASPFSSSIATISFDSDGGTPVAEQKALNSPAIKPDDPTKDGYDFVEWLKDGKAYDFSTPVTENITLTARWLVRLTGSGTAEDPYQIGTAEELKLFRDIVNGSNGQTQNRSACAVLTSDIVLNDGTFDDNGNYTGGSNAAPEQWTPMGDFINAYSGTFDGAGHSVKGLYYIADNNVDNSECLAGLFGFIDGATIIDVTVTGYIRRGVNPNNGMPGTAGGIAATATNSTIRDCRSICRITTNENGDTTNENGNADFCVIGGIVGTITGTTTVENCCNDGYITMINIRNSAAGGIVGNMSGGTVKNCINTGKVNAPKLYNPALDQVGCGGVVGRIYGGQIADCINIGEVNVADYGNAGGIVGYTNGDSITVRSCYSIGTVTAENNLKAGGICGTIKSDSPTFENCYYSDSLGLKAVGSGEGTINNTAPKAAAQFADGTVLQLLINGRTEGEHPWDTDCSSKQLTAGGPRLPVLAWQSLDTNHEDTDKDHLCDYCGKTISNHEDANKDHICDYCEKVISNHTGGVATCVGKTKCTFCGVEYGAIDPNHHESLTHVPEKSATTEAEGNKEYWHCEDCNKFFADDTAKTEINEKDTVIPKLLPEVTPTPEPTATPTPAPTEQPAATPSPTPTAEPTTAPTATPTAIPTAAPTATPTTVPTATPKPSVAENNPRTGDTANYTVWFALLGLSGAAAGMTIFAKKHRKNNR